MLRELSDERVGAGRQQLKLSLVPPEGDVHVADDETIRSLHCHTSEARETTTSHPSR